MEHMKLGPTCLSHPNGMWWLLLGAVSLVCTSVPAHLHPVTTAEYNTTSTPVPQLTSRNLEVSGSESPNVTHSYREETLAVESNTTDVASNAVDDHLVEVTSSLTKTECALCVEYNSTEIINATTNSSSLGNLKNNVTRGPETTGFFNIGIIIGITVLVVVILSLIGGLSFFAYRHFAWNRPQTLTDKFSNDESTGYIDDTAFRENSEEMYSLDNDSFLNSLEAMTIQNYWTDHVRHTKL